jgi:hypothetical protein
MREAAVMCFFQGLDVSRSLPRYFHDGVRALVCGPKPFHRELLQCVFDGQKFKLVRASLVPPSI